MGGAPWGPRDVQYGRWDGPMGYDRGLYGGGYEGPAGGYGDGPGRRTGWGGYGADFQEEWQGGYARGPFLPEQVYRRHPELDRAARPARRALGVRPGRHRLRDGRRGDSGRRAPQAVRGRVGGHRPLDVEVEDGVVTLRGEVDDFMEARYAWDDAWETEGVRGVINHLTVRVDQADAQPHGDVLPQSTQGTSTEPAEASGGGAGPGDT